MTQALQIVVKDLMVDRAQHAVFQVALREAFGNMKRRLEEAGASAGATRRSTRAHGTGRWHASTARRVSASSSRPTARSIASAGTTSARVEQGGTQ